MARKSVVAAVLALLFAGAIAVADIDIAGVTPSQPSIADDVPFRLGGRQFSMVDKALIGQIRLLQSGSLDSNIGTNTLPLYTGYHVNGDKHYYILTDSSDKGQAEALGLNYAPKLANLNRRGDDRVRLHGNDVVGRKGRVDFTPERIVVPNEEPTPFPPKRFQAGAVGDDFYTPFIRIGNGDDEVYNAPIVANDVDGVDLNMFCDGIPEDKKEMAYKYVHDRVVAICPRTQTVTVSLLTGFSYGRPILYLTMESNTELVSAVEGTTVAPALDSVAVGGDTFDSAFSSVEPLFTVFNGPSNADLPKDVFNPNRQGQISAIRGEAESPLNVLAGIPSQTLDYSPLWDIHPVEWTQEAIDYGIRTRLTDEFQVLGFVARGFLTAPGGGAFGPSGILVNCPISYRYY
mmetsp:Transcript_36060/g.88124  ORF Transcript_36060/g.88124 Transcript_36060/m.88124 type:complete len:403 (-) Transcript_36060:124-1332(-)